MNYYIVYLTFGSFGCCILVFVYKFKREIEMNRASY